MSRLVTAVLAAVALVGFVATQVPDRTAAATGGPVVIDFEAFGEGDLVTSVTLAGLPGPVAVGGWQAPDPTTHRAMIFDGQCLPLGTRAGCTGQDPDLFFPSQGNILIVSEDLDSSDPDDAYQSVLRFGFDGTGPVTVDSITLLDTNNQTTTLRMTLASGGTVEQQIGGTGDNGSAVVTVGVSDVVDLVVDLDGLGAVDDLVVRLDAAPPTTTTTSSTTSSTTSVPVTTTTAPATTTTTTPATTTTTTTTVPAGGGLVVDVSVDGLPVGSGAGPEVPAGASGTVGIAVTNTFGDTAYALYVRLANGTVADCPETRVPTGATVTCSADLVFSSGAIETGVTAKAWPEGVDLVTDARIAYVGVDQTSFVNIATEGFARQSDGTSWGSGAPAERAIDGSTDGHLDNGSVAMTYRVVGPWWEVDLGASYEIDHIRLWNRTDCCSERLERFHVFVSDVPFEVQDIPGTQSQPGVLDIHRHDPIGTQAVLPVARSGRFVRVQLDYQDAVLALAEVEVMVADTTPLPPPAAPALALSIAQSEAVIETGGTIDFTYSVENTGSERLWAPYVRHDARGAADCPGGALLPGATVVCSLTITPDPGAWTETVVLKAWADDGEVVVVEAPVEYLVTTPSVGSAVRVLVRHNGVPAAVPGPRVPFGSDQTWNYVVTNTGDTDLWALYLKHGDAVVSCADRDLAPGESSICDRVAPAGAGAVVDDVAVSMWDTAGDRVTDTVAVGYVTEVPADSRAIGLVASVAGDDAEAAPGPMVPEGDPLPLGFTVTNLGSVSVYGVWVNAPGFGTATCTDRDLDPGESVTCTIDDPAQPGQHASVVRAVAYDGAGDEIEAFDQIHVFVPDQTGADIHLDVLVDGLNGDQHAGPRIALGQTMTFSYLITNRGSETLDEIELFDTDHGDVVCPAQSVVPGLMLVCTVTEVADRLHTTHFDSRVDAVGGSRSVSDTERLYYHVRERGREESLTLEVSIAGADADTPPGPALEVGRTVQVRYVLTNTSTETAVYSASITDPRVPASRMSCSGGPFLNRGRSMVCTATITVEAGEWASIVSAHAYGQNGARIDASDRIHYTGIL